MLPGLCGLEDVGTTQPGWDFDAELPQQGVGKSQACSMEGEKKKNRFKECQKLKKYKVKQIPALLHHCHKRIETEKKKNRKEKNRRIEKRRGRGSDSNP